MQFDPMGFSGQTPLQGVLDELGNILAARGLAPLVEEERTRLEEYLQELANQVEQ